jgi:hypothetical protein
LPETYTDSAVSIGNTYWYKVAAVNAYGTSSFSNTASISFVLPPSGSITLTVPNSSSNQADVSWSYTDTNQDGFHIERSTDGGSTYSILTSVGPSVRSYADTTVTGPATYCYRTDAYNGSGTSSYSNATCVFIPITPFACGGIPTNMNETSWSKVTFMGSPPCADFVWNSGSTSATWYWKRSQFDSPCSSWIDVSTTICNPGAAYDITVTIPWDDSGNVAGSPPYQASFGLDINGSIVDNVVGDMLTATPSPIVLTGSIPATQVSTVRLYFASGGTLGGAPNGYTVNSLTDLTITPATHP